MKLFAAVAICLIGSVAQGAEPLEISPLRNIKPEGKGDGSNWTISFTPSYLAANREIITQPTVTFDVASGECAQGDASVVKMHGGFEVKVQQKICVGVVDGKTIIAGWLVSPGAVPKPLMDESLTEYGVGIKFVFDGNQLEADQSIYKFKAAKKASVDTNASS
ncbi:hypothetical protein [Pseudomonas sp. GXZC]|uniref:hypothetical protein n=1 Tax=Pseudomonas sp. GXZC TaxID=3003351 RepID=UPI0022AA43A2|nr:hypothetical protein [Pseudomonas sp. GXZC]WAT32282.1 hypothetical protein OZ428_33945 [Pseudomonas sp. GXZC]